MDSRVESLGNGDEFVDRLPTVGKFRMLRSAAEMAPWSREAVAQSLPNSLLAVVEERCTGEAVAMGHDAGEDGAIFHVCEAAVYPDHESQGLGTAVIESISMDIDDSAPPQAHVNLVADIGGFYEEFGIEETRPPSKRMLLRTD